MIDFDKI